MAMLKGHLGMAGKSLGYSGAGMKLKDLLVGCFLCSLDCGNLLLCEIFTSGKGSV